MKSMKDFGVPSVYLTLGLPKKHHHLVNHFKEIAVARAISAAAIDIHSKAYSCSGIDAAMSQNKNKFSVLESLQNWEMVRRWPQSEWVAIFTIEEIAEYTRAKK